MQINIDSGIPALL